MANTVAGVIQPLRGLYHNIKDHLTKLAIQNIENKISEMDNRLTDIERRASIGGI